MPMSQTSSREFKAGTTGWTLDDLRDPEIRRLWDWLVDVLDAECRESLGVDFRAWRSGRLKSSGTSAT